MGGLATHNDLRFRMTVLVMIRTLWGGLLFSSLEIVEPGKYAAANTFTGEAIVFTWPTGNLEEARWFNTKLALILCTANLLRLAMRLSLIFFDPFGATDLLFDFILEQLVEFASDGIVQDSVQNYVNSARQDARRITVKNTLAWCHSRRVVLRGAGLGGYQIYKPHRSHPDAYTFMA